MLKSDFLLAKIMKYGGEGILLLDKGTTWFL